MMCSPRRAAGSHSPSRVQERHMTRSLPVRWLVVLTLLMPISYGTIAFAAKGGDHVESKATHQAGVLCTKTRATRTIFSGCLMAPGPQ